tara:strand:- start:2938 stop:3315 length:378 start_codon:yes stop_codon:yes gene_type:complete
MKKHKICIVGGGLTGLISAIILDHKEVDIDLLINNKKKNIKDLRSTAISEENFNFLKSNIKNLNTAQFNSVKKINLYYQGSKKITNFLNFDGKKNLMFFFENEKFKLHLLKQIKKTRVNIIRFWH